MIMDELITLKSFINLLLYMNLAHVLQLSWFEGPEETYKQQRCILACMVHCGNVLSMSVM